MVDYGKRWKRVAKKRTFEDMEIWKYSNIFEVFKNRTNFFDLFVVHPFFCEKLHTFVRRYTNS